MYSRSKSNSALPNPNFSSFNLDGYMEILFNEVNRLVRLIQQMGSPHKLSYHSTVHHMCGFLKLLFALFVLFCCCCFLTAIWAPLGQLWAIHTLGHSLTNQMLIPAFLTISTRRSPGDS